MIALSDVTPELLDRQWLRRQARSKRSCFKSYACLWFQLWRKPGTLGSRKALQPSNPVQALSDVLLQGPLPPKHRSHPAWVLRGGLREVVVERAKWMCPMRRVLVTQGCARRWRARLAGYPALRALKITNASQRAKLRTQRCHS